MMPGKCRCSINSVMFCSCQEIPFPQLSLRRKKHHNPSTPADEEEPVLGGKAYLVGLSKITNSTLVTFKNVPVRMFVLCSSYPGTYHSSFSFLPPPAVPSTWFDCGRGGMGSCGRLLLVPVCPSGAQCFFHPHL